MGHRCNNEIDHNLKAGELRRPPTDQDACCVCGNLYKARCSRCKAARYCSGLCQIKHWRFGHKDECTEKKNKEDQDIRTAHETSQFNLLNKHKMGEMAHELTKEPVRYLEEVHTLASSPCTIAVQPLIAEFERNEIELLKLERDNWKTQTEFVSRRLQSFMKKPDQDQVEVEARIAESIKQEEYIRMLKSECAMAKSELQNERERVQRLTLDLEETTHSAIIKVEEARVAEMRKQEKCIRMMMSELAKMRRNIQEERKHDETKQSAIKKVEEIGRDLVTARNDLASAISKAEVAEEKISVLEEKIKIIDDKHVCTICLDKEKDMAFRCGHMTCRDCGSKIPFCPICREQITIRIRLFHG